MINAFALWKYDSFPYLLGGVVTEFIGSQVKVDGYDGYIFTPVKIVDIKTGVKLMAELTELKQKRDKELLEVKNKFDHDRDDILSRY